nr:MAG TPA: hypothetical protein [Bacteriophage sp.]DAZ75726.1 MAG TPA: hypothetical protein [Caudoviricetes sp.]
MTFVEGQTLSCKTSYTIIKRDVFTSLFIYIRLRIHPLVMNYIVSHFVW